MTEVAKAVTAGRAGEYSPDAAALFAVACGWSYGDGQTLVDVLHRCEFRGTCRRISVASGALFVDTDAYVLTDHEFAVVVFRGTEIGDAKIVDVLSDFYSHQVPFFAGDASGRVHVGFQQAYLPIHDHIVDALRAESKRVRALYFCGHSLGGALAVLAVAAMLLREDGDADCAELRAKFQGLYTYGQPMVGDETFAAACSERFGALTYRHVFQQDLIPQLPPRWTTGPFRHFGFEYRGDQDSGWAPSKGDVGQVTTAVLPLAVAAGGFIAKQVRGLRWLAERLPYSLDDHRPQAYIDCSKRAVGAAFVFP